MMRRLIVLLGLVCPVAGDSFVEWNPALDVVEDAVWRLPVEPVAMDDERLVVKDGHFFVGEKRFRVWGVNLSFGANLPDAKDAPKVAERLAAAGVNSVRMHHMDTAKFPRGLWHREGGFRIDPEAFERLDFFIAKLAKRGIRVNLNVHVGGHYSRMLDTVPEGPCKYDKAVLMFAPESQRAWRDWAKMLLEHKNPHRDGLRYADDPAIAWVEITNENSFWFGSYLKQVREGSVFYQKMLSRQFAAWLKRQYGDDAGLAKAWNIGAEPLGENQLPSVSEQGKWRLEIHKGAAAELAPTNSGVRIKPTKLGEQSWHLQFGIRPLKVEGGKYHTLQFRARADKERRLSLTLGMAHEPWGSLGLSERVNLGPEWKTYRFGFTTTASDDNARISMSFGDSLVPFDLHDVRLQPGGQVGVAEGESIVNGQIPLWTECETPARSNDRLRFLAATEKAFFDMARKWIRDELGCKAPVSGTQGYGPCGLSAQDGMDYIDTHAYWQHPSFPRKPWDPGDWIVRQRSMVEHAEQSTLLKLASHRVPGRPFTVSEYNHPAPNDCQAETVPLMAAVAAVEDWDGIWFYTYEHDNGIWDLAKMTNFFDLRGNPAKWAFMPAGARLYRDGGIDPLENSFLRSLVPPSPEETWEDPAAAMAKHRKNLAGRGESTGALAAKLYCNRKVPEGMPKRGFALIDGPGGGVAIGYAEDFEERTLGVLKLEGPEFCAVTLVALDGKPASESARLLFTGCGRAENVGMGFNEARNTVGRDWGEPPVRAEALTGTWRLPPGEWIVRALKPDGSKGEKVETSREGGRAVLRLGPEHGTVCYFLERL